MSMKTGSKLHFEPGSLLESLHDVYMGTIVGAAHSGHVVKKWFDDNLASPLLRAFSLKSDEEVHSKDGIKTLKVIAVGYGRTGTYSLALALDELGIPTLHTQHLYEHEALLTMWTNEVFFPSVQAKKITMGKPDLNMIASYGYQATADLPMALYYEQVMEEFPDCKFILTTRENSEIWFRSWETLTKSITQPVAICRQILTHARQLSYYLRWLFAVVNNDESYLTASFPLPDQQKEAAIASYEEHNRRVREKIPKEKLLEYNVKQGWEPLCQFLEIEECPETPFPRTNSALSVQVQSVSAFVVPIVCTAVCLYWAYSKFLRRKKGKA